MKDEVMKDLTFGVTTEVTYTNHRGETARRKIRPLSLWYGRSPWHKEAQWLLEALDVETGMYRTFALKDMKP